MSHGLIRTTIANRPVSLPTAARDTPAETKRKIVLGYHELSDGESGYLYEVSRKQFEGHLRVVNELRNMTPGVSVAITFDDGHLSNFSIALPTLETHASKGAFFLIAGRVGKRPDFMTWAQVRELSALGHEVASHSWSHVFLTECSDSQLRMELSRSKATIEDQTGVTVSAISAPHGRWNKRVAQACLECGYSRLYTSNPWQRTDRGAALQACGRMIVRKGMSSQAIRHRATMTNAEAALRRCLYSTKRAGLWVLGDSLYHRLWGKLSGWKGSDDRGETLSEPRE